MKQNKIISTPLIIIILTVIVISIIIVTAILMNSDNKNTNNNEVNAIINEEFNNIVQEIKQENYEQYDEGIAKFKLPKVEVGVIAQQNSTIDANTPTFYNPVIPKGFRAITNIQDSTIDENAVWGEQNAYLYGLVIEDSNKNQFVWIPVENMDLFKTVEWKKNEQAEIIDSTYIEPLDEEKEEYYKMYYKIKKYGGFYVGRYETGDVDATQTRNETKNSDNIGIRKNLVVYNYVPYTKSTINKREIIGAKELTQKFIQNNSYETVTGSVMYGVQWDSMLRFIKSDTKNVNDSIKWGNYPVSTLKFKDVYGNDYTKEANTNIFLLRAGSSEETKAKNIYDIAGNLAEWTNETTKKNVNVARGGSYVSTISQLAAARYAYSSNTANNAIGFRISFYIN